MSKIQKKNLLPWIFLNQKAQNFTWSFFTERMPPTKDFGGRKKQKWSHVKNKTSGPKKLVQSLTSNEDKKAWILFGKNVPLGSKVMCMKPYVLAGDMYCLDLRDKRCDYDLVGDRGMFHLDLDPSIVITDLGYRTMNWQGTIAVHGPAPAYFCRDRCNYLVVPAAGIEVFSRGEESVYVGCPYIKWPTIQLLGVLNSRVPEHEGHSRFLYVERDAVEREDPSVAYFTATELFA